MLILPIVVLLCAVFCSALIKYHVFTDVFPQAPPYADDLDYSVILHLIYVLLLVTNWKHPF